MQTARILGLALGLAVAAIPQDLPPGVLLYSQIKRHVAQQLEDLQNYTCLETIHRYQGIASRKADVGLRDTVRLEVLYTGKKELFSAPGERNFVEDNPGAYVGDGLSQDGLFGGYLFNVVVGGNARVTYRGEEELDGRRYARYEYGISSSDEPLYVDMGSSGQGSVGIRGTFWADPVSKDVSRLDIEPDDIPPTLPIKSSISILRFAPVRIGNRNIMLPQSVDSQVELAWGHFERNVLELTHCRAFEAESSIEFSPAERSQPGAMSRPLLPGADTTGNPPIPAGLHVALSLSETVDEKTPAGTQIEARVAGPVFGPRARRSGSRPQIAETVIAEGTVVRGRVRSLARQTGAEDAYLLAVEFCDIEVNGVRQRFFAELESADRVPEVEPIVTSSTSGPEAPADLPGVAYFTIRGKGAGLRSGFHTTWKTVSLTQ